MRTPFRITMKPSTLYKLLALIFAGVLIVNAIPSDAPATCKSGDALAVKGSATLCIEEDK